MERETLIKLVKEYKEKIARYQAMVDEWQKELGMPGEAILISPDSDHDSEGREQPIKEWQFYGKSQPEAAKALLESVNHPMKTEEIVEAIEKGGVTVGGNTKQKKVTNLYTILHRNENFAIVKRGSWGLVGWPGVKKKEGDDGPDGNPNPEEKPADGKS